MIFTNYSESQACVYWIAEEDGKITGGCGIYSTPGLPEGCAELVKLYLLPEHRGKGIGKMLMEKSFESAQRPWLQATVPGINA